MEMKPLVHLVDDDEAFRDSTQVLLASVGVEVVVHASAEEFLDAAHTARPCCLLLDLRMPWMNGLEVQRLLRERGQDNLPIIFISGHADVETSVLAMQQGAIDFLVKPVSEEKLLQRVYQALELSKELRAAHNSRATLNARLDLLSARERQVLEGVCAGYSNKEIAHRLHISHKTVELHRSNVMTKMRADSLAALVQMLMRAREQH